MFRAELKKAGVTVRGGTASLATPATKRAVLATDYSMPLSQLLVPFLKLSNNMHAEASDQGDGRAAVRGAGHLVERVGRDPGLPDRAQGADERGRRCRTDPV